MSRRQFARVLTIAAGVVCIHTAQGQGSTPAKPPWNAAAPQDTLPMILVVSGGVSLGAYQGGLNWALVELMRLSQQAGFRDWLNTVVRADSGFLPPLRLQEATGASAGNINALLSAIEWCRVGGYARPEDSLFWRVWVQTGWEQLFAQVDSAALDSA